MNEKQTRDECRPLSFGAHLLPRDYLASWETQERRNREMLSHALNLRDTIVFAGAGCSIPLGYPSWKKLATDCAIVLARKAIEKATGASKELKARCESRLNELECRVRCGVEAESANHAQPGRAVENTLNQLSAADLTSVLGGCQETCEQCGCQNDFRGQIAELFKPKNREEADAVTPYDLLVGLPVRRFVTSNYDCELEAALIRKRKLRREDYNCGRTISGNKSFAQTAKYDEQLAAYSIAMASDEPRVFHCHGWHHEADSMVLTEDDYQRWYFRDQAIGGRYRQTIDLIFNSNPLLFVGLSLTDDDLLIPLRFLSAVDREKKHSRPLFALLKRSSHNDEIRFEQLYDRYGIHVVTFPAEADQSKAMCQALREIAECCRAHRKEWLEKPGCRTPHAHVGKREPFLHYQPILDARQQKSIDETQLPWPDLRRTRLVWIVGPGGTGKSWDAIEKLKRLQARGTGFKFKGFFFWSFRYCNDALSGIEQALNFMGVEAGPAEEAFDHLVAQLSKERYFVVLDGMERFLKQNVKWKVVAVESLYKRFFAALADKRERLKSVLVLTSRVLPEVFKPFAQRCGDGAMGRVAILQAKGFRTERIRSILRENNGASQEEEAARLCDWFRGHRYGVTLAAQWLQEHGFEQLEYEMAEADPEHRVQKMIGLALKAIRESDPPTGEAAYRLLERLAVFVEPVDEEIARTCPDANSRDQYDAAIELLKNKKLVFEVLYYDGQKHYLVHPSTREYIFHHEHHSSPADLPSFALSGFTSDAATIYPGDRQGVGKKTVVGLLESLTREASKTTASDDRRRELCRAAFGVVRSRMGATAVTRWSRYDEYLRFLIEVIDVVRRRSQEQKLQKTSANGRAAAGRGAAGGALYAEELAWLYNEAGLAYYGEGSMLDAIAVWDVSYEINRDLDGDGDGHHVFQSLCNLGAAYIHFGRLRKADWYLHRAIEMGRRLKEKDHVARIEVYLALLCHLRGNIGEANYQYGEVTKRLHDLGNMRAYSIALRHHADLLLKQEGTRSQAWEKIQTSKAVAETNSYHDLVAHTRLSYGHLHRVEKKFPDAIREYRAALDLARTMGLRRLEAEAQSELARVDLDLGDSQVARRRAMTALQIANEHLLGLRQTHCLVILGRATIHAGDRELGVHYLRYAKRLADEQEYHLRASEAEAALYEIGEAVENPEIEVTH